MTSFDDLVHRVATDPAFAEQVRTDPRRALAVHALTDEQLRLLDRAVRPLASDPPVVAARSATPDLPVFVDPPVIADRPADEG